MGRKASSLRPWFTPPFSGPHSPALFSCAMFHSLFHGFTFTGSGTTMASGRARLPPTPGTVGAVSAASCTRPTLTELHTNNNLYHASSTAIGPGEGGVGSSAAAAAVEYQHPMHHSSHVAQQHLAGVAGTVVVGAGHHPHQHHQHHHQQEAGMTAGATTSQMLPDVALLGHGVTQSLRKPFDAPRHM